GLLFLALEPHNRFVRFHAMQSVLVFGPSCIAFFICLSIPLVGWLAAIVIFYGSAVLWLLLMYKAYRGERFKLPVAGEMAEGRICLPPRVAARRRKSSPSPVCSSRGPGIPWGVQCGYDLPFRSRCPRGVDGRPRPRSPPRYRHAEIRQEP